MFSCILNLHIFWTLQYNATSILYINYSFTLFLFVLVSFWMSFLLSVTLFLFPFNGISYNVAKPLSFVFKKMFLFYINFLRIFLWVCSYQGLFFPVIFFLKISFHYFWLSMFSSKSVVRLLLLLWKWSGFVFFFCLWFFF